MKYENYHVHLHIDEYGCLSMVRECIGTLRQLVCSHNREHPCTVDCPLFRLHFSEDGTMTAHFCCGKSEVFYYVDYLENKLVESEVTND